jgi:uncharacterized membrane protein
MIPLIFGLLALTSLIGALVGMYLGISGWGWLILLTFVFAVGIDIQRSKGEKE